MGFQFSPGNYRATGGDGGTPPYANRVFTGTAAVNCTFAMWLRRDVDQNTYGTYWATQGAHYLALITGSNGDNLRLDSNYEDSGLDAQSDPTGFLPLTTGTWYYVAITLAGLNATLYSAPLGTPTLTVADTWTQLVSGPDFTHTGFGMFPQYGVHGQGSLAFYRSWSGQTLTKAELEAEMASATPVKTTGLWADHRFASGALDQDSSGNANHMNESAGTGGAFTADPVLAAAAATNVYNGSAFVDATAAKVWNGSAFVDATAVKVWNGSAFVNAV